MSIPRLIEYMWVAGWLGSVQNSWFSAWLNHDDGALISTSVLTVLLLVALGGMCWWDYRHQRVGQVNS